MGVHLIIYLACTLFFLGNDFFFVLGAPDHATFTLFEFTYRVLIVAVLFSLPTLQHLHDCGTSYRPNFLQAGDSIIAPTVLIIGLFLVEQSISYQFGIERYFEFPPPDSFVLFLLDITLGLALVSFSETLVSVVLPLRMIQEYRLSGWWMMLVASLLFGLSHWSRGPTTMVAATLANIYFFWIAKQRRSVGAVLIVHYLVDLYFFGSQGFVLMDNRPS
ncbi:MAG: hypothetical protein A2516_05135 [Alphaproteobacteria bacterium RIFOXYD12_FULL_60_8]|nr:MAG: hypothetical protein A2516_05135 [Alphaproteobacteria bacterium RIFOXYD12_FULL_60_8]